MGGWGRGAFVGSVTLKKPNLPSQGGPPEMGTRVGVDGSYRAGSGARTSLPVLVFFC